MGRPLFERLLAALLLLFVLSAAGWLVLVEVRASPIQSTILSDVAARLTWRVEPGPSPDIRHPEAGPYDLRLGYVRLQDFIGSLGREGYAVERQARWSEALRTFVDAGGYALYHEKTRAGLEIRDRSGAAMFVSRHPERAYPDFDSIPSLVVAALLFIEDRELLDERHSRRNPAIDWARMTGATFSLVAEAFSSEKRYGGSTLATQIEKFRHSAEGRTEGVGDKLRQMVSASVRAYQDGSDTTLARRRLVVDYLNSTPLAGRSSFGEVIGLGDGLWAWYGSEFEAANAGLRATPADASALADKARLFKQVTSLLLAQRRPSYYLEHGFRQLVALTDAHLRVFGRAGLIDDALRDAALAAELRRSPAPPPAPTASPIDQKAASAVRVELLSRLGIRDFYALDRLDLGVDTTVDADVQRDVTRRLRSLGEPATATAAGLTGARLLAPRHAGAVRYSVALYERKGDANHLVVQTDNYDGALDLNAGSKMDLGSTAKLRTLVSYLQIVAELHGRYAALTPSQLEEALADAEDPLTRWALSRLLATGERRLEALLDAAMQRPYSASPAEQFFTGRGLHTFANFDNRHDHQVIPVADAFRHSVNLVFVRMMRDIVRFHIAEGPGTDILVDRDHPDRRLYLSRFADREGAEFLSRFYRIYQGRSPDEALDVLASRVRPSARRLAVAFRSVRPEADVEALGAFIAKRLPHEPVDPGQVQKLFATYAPGSFSLADRGYLARIHPLELWVVAHLQERPSATYREILAAGADARQEAYTWLFRSKSRRAVDNRIRMVLEEDAFRRIHQSWRELGYPFDSLVPSLATAIGSSADQPQALAELMGILVNDGLRLPTLRIRRLHFAADTPYEVALGWEPASEARRVLAPEVAATVRLALADVVASGTARRVSGAFTRADGAPLAIGGKTGTADEMLDRPGGAAAARQREVGRSAAFVFFAGDRHFGTVTAHVPGSEAGLHGFTSALPVQVLKAIAPALEPLVREASVLAAAHQPTALALGAE